MKNILFATGKYLYIETSAPRVIGNKAWLVSQTFPPVSSSGRCIHFWYSMYGQTVGMLRVIVRIPGAWIFMMCDAVPTLTLTLLHTYMYIKTRERDVSFSCVKKKKHDGI